MIKRKLELGKGFLFLTSFVTYFLSFLIFKMNYKRLSIDVMFGCIIWQALARTVYAYLPHNCKCESLVIGIFIIVFRLNESTDLDEILQRCRV